MQVLSATPSSGSVPAHLLCPVMGVPLTSAVQFPSGQCMSLAGVVHCLEGDTVRDPGTHARVRYDELRRSREVIVRCREGCTAVCARAGGPDRRKVACSCASFAVPRVLPSLSSIALYSGECAQSEGSLPAFPHGANAVLHDATSLLHIDLRRGAPRGILTTRRSLMHWAAGAYCTRTSCTQSLASTSLIPRFSPSLPLRRGSSCALVRSPAQRGLLLANRHLGVGVWLHFG